MDSTVRAASAMLPRLRAELALLQGALSVTGQPTWLIHDPLQHSYIQIDLATYHTLAAWSDCRTLDDLLVSVKGQRQVEIDPDGVARLVDFLERHKLIDLNAGGEWKKLNQQHGRRHQSKLMWLAHNYLFLKIPLCRPQAFLDRSLPWVRSVFRPLLFRSLALFGVIGLYLVSRQWDAFISTFQQLLTWEGAAAVAVTIAAVKLATNSVMRIARSTSAAGFRLWELPS